MKMIEDCRALWKEKLPNDEDIRKIDPEIWDDVTTFNVDFPL